MTLDVTTSGLVFGQLFLAAGVIACAAMILAVARRAPTPGEETDDYSSLIGADTRAATSLTAQDDPVGGDGFALIVVLSFHCSTCRAEAQRLLKERRRWDGIGKQLLVMGPAPSAPLADSHPISELMRTWPSHLVNFGDPTLGELDTLSVVPTFILSRNNVVIEASHRADGLKLLGTRSK